MSRYAVILPLILLLGAMAEAAPQNDVADALAHAEALYYEAKFKESISVLLRINEVLDQQQERLKEKVNVKLQLALAHIGLNENAQAKSRLNELFSLDPNFSLDAQQFAPKVVAMADEVKAEQNEMRRRKMCDEALRRVNAGEPVAPEQLDPMKGKCPGLAAAVSAAADALYRKGLEAYKRDQIPEALDKFRSALKLHPAHELASQYLDLAVNKLRVAIDQTFIEWRRNFEAQKFGPAAEGYHQLVALNVDGDAASMLDQMRAQYRTALAPIVESWNKACASGDKTGVEGIRNRAHDLLPDRSIGQDFLDRMTTCTNVNCVRMEPRNALVRVKKETQAQPELTPAMRSFIQNTPVTVKVAARISDRGDVSVTNVTGANVVLNDAVRTAVQKWKFLPAVIQGEPRCVETEISVVISPSAGSVVQN